MAGGKTPPALMRTLLTREFWLGLLVLGMVLKQALPGIATTLIRLEFIILFVWFVSLKGLHCSPSVLLYGLLAFLYIGTAFVSGPLPAVVKADFYSIVFGGGLGIALVMNRLKNSDWSKQFLIVHRFVAIASLLSAVLGLIKIVALIYGIEVPYALRGEDGLFPTGSSLHRDYNVYSLGLAYGLFSILWLQKYETKKTVKSIVNVAIPVIFIAIISSGSRRGVIFVAIFMVIYLVNIASSSSLNSARSIIVLRFSVWAFFIFGVFLQRQQISFLWADFVSSSEYAQIATRMETIELKELFASRSFYWNYTVEMLAEFTPVNLVLGSGFGYVENFGQQTGVAEDYPHNFFLSALLYGGILQLLLTLFTIGVAMKKALAGKEITRPLFYWLALEITFLSFSSNSFFSSMLASVVTIVALGLPAQPNQAGKLQSAATRIRLFKKIQPIVHATV